MQNTHWRENRVLGGAPIKEESHIVTSLQDFVRTIGIPNVMKRDNFKTQRSEKWTNVEQNLCVHGKITELHSPWENMTEHGINNLSIMTT